MILLIDDQEINLVVYGTILKRLFGNNNVTTSQYLEPEHLKKNWEYIFIDMNSDEKGSDGKIVKQKIIDAKPELAERIFLISSNEHFGENFINKEKLIDFIKNKYNITSNTRESK